LASRTTDVMPKTRTARVGQRRLKPSLGLRLRANAISKAAAASRMIHAITRPMSHAGGEG
jgi:hypothetical protein